ncbi:MAG TPA: ABC transporter permease [Candidatus Nanoarchaeia archaeon]|nr:ABC transporter permease [Candidatus Nanoarchaeia archaeon]
MSQDHKPTAEHKRRSASQWAVAWRRFRRSKTGVVGLIIVLAVIVLGITGDFIAPYPAFPNPKALTPFYNGDVRTSPSSHYLLGTDVLGTDVLSDILHGTKYALYVGVVVTAITMAIAILVGAIAGYFGGWIDNVLMRITEVFLVFPSLLFILVFVRVLTLGSGAGSSINFLGISIPIGLTIVVLVLAIFNWPGDARMIRGEFLRVRELEFVEAEKALGASNRRIIFRHILPNILSSIIVVASLTVAYAILLEAGVSFLGFGDVNTMTWGQILENNFSDARIVWWALVFPGIAILITVFGFNLLGDGLSDALNPRLRD